MNQVPGSKPILVEAGQASVDVEVKTVTFDLELDMSADEYDEEATILQLASYYGVDPSLIVLEATQVAARRKLATRGGMAIKVTIEVPEESADVSGVADSAVAGSAAEQLAAKLAQIDAENEGGAGLSAALGVNVTQTAVAQVVTEVRQVP